MQRGGRPEETDAVSVDDAFDALADTTRRHLLYYLAEEADGPAEVSDLAERLHARDPVDGYRDRRTIHVGLRHRHLPKLEAAGLVEHDPDVGAVRYVGDPFVEECLALVATRDADSGR